MILLFHNTSSPVSKEETLLLTTVLTQFMSLLPLLVYSPGTVLPNSSQGQLQASYTIGLATLFRIL